MTIGFEKYHGNGNDFIMIDNRRQVFDESNTKRINELCERRYGIGADGLILLNNSNKYDFYMKYYNADGRESTLCGNGGRCIVRFAQQLKLINKDANFMAIDGAHQATINDDGTISLKMNNVSQYSIAKGGDLVLDTGSPHYVTFVDKLAAININQEGEKIRNRDEFVEEGINVNFVQKTDGVLKVRTYERGVESETHSCGTGVVAAALADIIKSNAESTVNEIKIETIGGPFKVSFTKNNNVFEHIWLTGNAKFVFKGEIEI